MKTSPFFLLFLALFSAACEKGAALPQPPAARDSPAEAPARPCPYPVYDPPAIVPGTNCVDPCQFVYEGWVDFEEEVLEINCRQLPLSSPALSFSIDSTLVRYVGRGFLKILRITAPDIGPWCAGMAFFRAEGCPGPEQYFLCAGYDGTSEFQVAWPEGFWDCAAGKRISFRLVARKPLALEGGGEP